MNKMMKIGRGAAAICLAITTLLAGALTAPITAYAGEVAHIEKSKPGDLMPCDAPNPIPESFNVPTQVFGYGGEYFVLDAYNQQILHSKNVYNAPENWNVMGNKLYRPHALATDGTLYVAVDTDNDRVVTYGKNEKGFQVVESFEGVGIRPHYITYDQTTGFFYVWSSMTGVMYLYQRVPNTLQLQLVKAVPVADLYGAYTRSFTIDGNYIYFPSMGKNAIYVVDKKTFKLLAVYPVAQELGGMVQVLHIQNYYYLVTSSDAAGDQKKQAFVRSASLAGFVPGGYEDASALMGGLDGVPYYITQLEDGRYYTPVIMGYYTLPYICRFEIVNDTFTNVKQMKYK